MYNFFKYPVRWQKLLGNARSGSTALSYRNSVITPGWRLMRAGITRAFTRSMMKKNISIYIYRERERRSAKRSRRCNHFKRVRI